MLAQARQIMSTFFSSKPQASELEQTLGAEEWQLRTGWLAVKGFSTDNVADYIVESPEKRAERLECLDRVVAIQPEAQAIWENDFPVFERDFSRNWYKQGSINRLEKAIVRLTEELAKKKDLTSQHLDVVRGFFEETNTNKGIEIFEKILLPTITISEASVSPDQLKALLEVSEYLADLHLSKGISKEERALRSTLGTSRFSLKARFSLKDFTLLENLGQAASFEVLEAVCNYLSDSREVSDAAQERFDRLNSYFEETDIDISVADITRKIEEYSIVSDNSAIAGWWRHYTDDSLGLIFESISSRMSPAQQRQREESNHELLLAVASLDLDITEHENYVLISLVSDGLSTLKSNGREAGIEQTREVLREHLQTLIEARVAISGDPTSISIRGDVIPRVPKGGSSDFLKHIDGDLLKAMSAFPEALPEHRQFAYQDVASPLVSAGITDPKELALYRNAFERQLSRFQNPKDILSVFNFFESGIKEAIQKNKEVLTPELYEFLLTQYKDDSPTESVLAIKHGINKILEAYPEGTEVDLEEIKALTKEIWEMSAIHYDPSSYRGSYIHQVEDFVEQLARTQDGVTVSGLQKIKETLKKGLKNPSGEGPGKGHNPGVSPVDITHLLKVLPDPLESSALDDVCRFLLAYAETSGSSFNHFVSAMGSESLNGPIATEVWDEMIALVRQLPSTHIDETFGHYGLPKAFPYLGAEITLADIKSYTETYLEIARHVKDEKVYEQILSNLHHTFYSVADEQHSPLMLAKLRDIATLDDPAPLWFFTRTGAISSAFQRYDGVGRLFFRPNDEAETRVAIRDLKIEPDKKYVSAGILTQDAARGLATFAYNLRDDENLRSIMDDQLAPRLRAQGTLIDKERLDEVLSDIVIEEAV